MRPAVERDYEWAKGFEPAITEIVTQHLATRLIGFEPSSPHEDLKEATDMVPVIRSTAGRIAVRIRRPTAYRDLTIRCWRESGATTEAQKIINGFGDFYFYGWTDGEVIRDWVLIDLETVRATDLLSGRTVKYNYDQTTGFYSITIPELAMNGALIAKQLELNGNLSTEAWCFKCRKGPLPSDALHWTDTGKVCLSCLFRETH